MMLGFLLAVASGYIISVAEAKQPGAPEPYPAPLRALHYGQLNFLHTTDTHGWHAGHLSEPSFAADWGDYIDFASRLRERLEAEGKDLLIVDTGDRIEGNGLYDASDPKGKYTFDIFKEQQIDIICSGNHELYKQNSSETEFNITVPAFKGSYLASNLDIRDPTTGELVPLANRYKKFTTKKQGIRVTAFGFLYDFQGNYPNTVVRPVEGVLKEDWFREATIDKDVDLFIVAGHAAVRSDEFDAIFRAIRDVQPSTPIQFFGGHYHIRDYKQFDNSSYGLASGRFMETIGFQSIDGLSPTNKADSSGSHPTFYRRYIDNNLYSFYRHSGHNESSFHSDRGRAVSQMIEEARSALELNTTFGCAPRDLWMARAKYPSEHNIYSWLEDQVLSEAVNDRARSDVPRLILTNTGAIRFDIFAGPFTKDSTYIVCPFTSGFHYLKHVPYSRAKKLIQILNNAGDFLALSDTNMDLRALAPPDQRPASLARRGPSVLAVNGHDDRKTQHRVAGETVLQPGYTTRDDAGDDGDDTLHSAISFYQVPNCVQSLVNTTSLEEDGATVDLIFNEFIQPYILLALRFLGLSFSEKDVKPYMYGENFTTLMAKWITENWAKNC